MRVSPSLGMREVIGDNPMPPMQQRLIVLPEHRRAGGTVTPPHKPPQIESTMQKEVWDVSELELGSG